MGSHALKAFALLCAGILFWLLASRVTGAGTPWESDAYWYFWYPLCLALAGMAGFFLRDDGWIAGGNTRLLADPCDVVAKRPWGGRIVHLVYSGDPWGRDCDARRPDSPPYTRPMIGRFRAQFVAFANAFVD